MAHFQSDSSRQPLSQPLQNFALEMLKKKQNARPFIWGEKRLPVTGIKSDFEAAGLLEPPVGPHSDDALVMEHHRWTWIRVMQH